MTRLICLHDGISFLGGGERVLFRVASIARRHASTDLGLLWATGKPDVDADLLAGFERIETFAFPEGMRPCNALALGGAMKRLRDWIQEQEATGIISFALRTALHVAPLARQLDLPLGWFCQQSFPLFESRFAAAKQWVALRDLALARSQIVCASDEGKTALESAGVPAARLQRIRNGIDFEHYAAAAMTDEDKRRWRSAHGIAAADLVAVCVARLDPLKEHLLLLRAVRRAADEGVRIALACVGEGAGSGSAGYVDSLHRVSAEIGIADRVSWAGYQADVRPWLGMADVAVLGSRKECASLALAEAGACGLPLVASRVGGNPEIVRDGETGLLFRSGDDGACAAALCLLARDPDQRRRMGEQARSLVREEFSSARWDEEWSRFLQGLLGRKTDS